MYNVAEVVGVWRDHSTEEKMVAVIWEEGNPEDGGSWIQFDELHLGLEPSEVQRGVEDSDDEDAFALSGAEDAENGDTMRWHDHFGTGLTEGTEMVVQWVEETKTGKVFRNYLGALTGDFDSGTYSHSLEYQRCTANKDLHTQGNRTEDEHLMNLASLQVDKPSADQPRDELVVDQFFSFWVKASYANLPFVTKHLFEVDVAHEPPNDPSVQRSRKRKQVPKARNKDTDLEPSNRRLTRQQKFKADMIQEIGFLS